MLTENAAPLITLRQQLADVAGYHQRQQLMAPCLDFTIPRGVLVSLLGTGKSEWVAQFLAQHASLRVAWIEEELTIYPCALMQRGVDLERILFTEAKGDMLWVTQQIIRSNLFDIVVVNDLITNDRALRRLHMFAEKAQAMVLLLSDSAYPTWSIALKLKVVQSKLNLPLQVEVMKRRI